MDRLFEIGDVVRKLRKTKLKIGVLEFARRAKVNKATLSNIERGGNYQKETLESIADAFGLTVAELYAYVPHYEANVTEKPMPEERARTAPKRKERRTA